MNGQEQVIVLLLKVFLISGFAANVLFISTYSKIAKWWRNPVGRSLVIESGLIALLLVPTALSLFLSLSRTTSDVAGWADVVLIGAITPVMTWRSIVWLRMYRAGHGAGE